MESGYGFVFERPDPVLGCVGLIALYMSQVTVEVYILQYGCVYSQSRKSRYCSAVKPDDDL